MIRIGKFSALFLSTFLLTTVDASAANLTANTSTDDCSGGTGGLQECLDVAVDNGETDTITLEAGTYSNGTYTYNAAITAEDFPLTLQGPAGGGAVLDGGDTILSIELIASGVGDTNTTFTIRQLVFSNGGDTGLRITTVDGDVVIENSEFTGNDGVIGGGIDVQSSESGNIAIRNNTFTGNIAASSGGGFFASTDVGNITVQNNLFDGNRTETFDGGAFTVETEGADSQFIMVNNVLSGNESGADAGGAFIEIEDAGSAIITNNTVFGNTTTGNGGGLSIFLEADGELSIYNNIIYGNSAGSVGDDINVPETSGSVSLFNNLYTETVIDCDGPCLTEGNNIIGEDPLFVDSAAGDFHLTADSPARDAGDPAAPEMPPTDFDGNPRPDQPGTNPDIGAFEFQAPAPTPSPTPTPTAGPTPDLSGGGCSFGGLSPLPASELWFGLSALTLAVARWRKRD